MWVIMLWWVIMLLWVITWVWIVERVIAFLMVAMTGVRWRVLVITR